MPTAEAHIDVALIGGGVMSATLATLLRKVDPSLRMVAYERLDHAAAESSDAWNNAGTGHSGFCELNYTPQESDGRDADAARHRRQLRCAVAVADHVDRRSLRLRDRAVARGAWHSPRRWRLADRYQESDDRRGSNGPREVRIHRCGRLLAQAPR